MTAAVIHVSTPVKKRLGKYSSEHREAVKQAIIFILGRAPGMSVSPNTIKEIFDGMAANQTRREYERGLISKGEYEVRKNERTVSERTIKRAVADLFTHGLVEGDKKRGLYNLTVKCKSDVRYFANRFGNTLLDLLMLDYDPVGYPAQKHVEMLVRTFGTFILFCFITSATHPVSSTATSNKHSRRYEERLVSSCLGNIIPIERMFKYFLTILDYGLAVDVDNSKIKNDIKSLLRCLTYPPEHKKIRGIFESESGADWTKSNSFSAGQLNILRMLLQEEGIKERMSKLFKLSDRNKDKSWNIPDEAALKRFSDAFNEEYPIFKVMSDYENFGLKNPKQKILDIQDSGPSLFSISSNFSST